MFTSFFMLLLSTDTLHGYGMNRIFGFAKDAGFDGIELALEAKNYDSQNAEYLNELSKEYDLPIRAVRTFTNSSIKQTSLALELARDVKAKVLIVEPPRLFDFKYKEWMRKEVPALRKRYDLRIALKNGPTEYTWGILPGRSLNSVPDLQNFKEVCLDISNLAAKKMDLMRTYEMMNKYLVHVHLSNVKRDKDHQLMSEGIMPLESFLTKLSKDKYEFDLSLSVKPAYVAVGNDEKMMKILQSQRKYFDKYWEG